MIKKSLICCALALSIPFLAASCADMKDADHCYRLARLSCQKSCVDPDEDHCIAQLKASCHEADQVEDSVIDDCADKLDALADCAGKDAVAAACANRDNQIGKKCVSSSDCPGSQSCFDSVCTSSCDYDDACSRYTTASGAPTYCNGDGSSKGVCIGVCQSNSDCSGTWVCQPNGSVKTCGPASTTPQAKGALGDPCDTSSDCQVGQCSLGYCSKSCQSQSSCSGLTSDGGTVACVALSGAVSAICLPSCSTTSDCASGSVCKPQTTPEGSTRSVCFEDPNATMTSGTKLFGQACSSASDCRDANARCEGFCTKSCVGDLECGTSSGSRTAGRCVSGVVSGNSICLPGCSPVSSGQCEGDSTCAQTSTTSGGTAYLCRPASNAQTSGRVGDACASNTDCNAAAGISCSFGMCTKGCPGFAACPAASPPRESICVSVVPGFSDALACTVTCENSGCLPGWTCTFDSNSGSNVCTHPLN